MFEFSIDYDSTFSPLVLVLTLSAFGTVYSGVHNGTGEKHAIKEICKISAFEEADKKDLKAELVALSDVGHHANLVRFYGAHYTLSDSVWVCRLD